MILIIGGMCQGKHDFCKKEYPEADVIDNYEKRVRDELESGLDPITEAEKLLTAIDNDSAAELVILMREVGSGVVPMDRSERLWREQTGRVSCFFAERADRVYRMLAGIPQRLK